MIKSINFFNILKLFDIIIIHLIFINSNNLELTSIKYPTTYVLLNQHIVFDLLLQFPSEILIDILSIYNDIFFL